jgi:hypothetical protein
VALQLAGDTRAAIAEYRAFIAQSEHVSAFAEQRRGAQSMLRELLKNPS